MYQGNSLLKPRREAPFRHFKLHQVNEPLGPQEWTSAHRTASGEVASCSTRRGAVVQMADMDPARSSWM